MGRYGAGFDAPNVGFDAPLWEDMVHLGDQKISTPSCKAPTENKRMREEKQLSEWDHFVAQHFDLATFAALDAKTHACCNTH